jgi:hypothetical protein
VKPLIPAPRTQWTEAAGKALVKQRAAASTDGEASVCEVSGTTWQLEFSHRLAAGRGGTYAPSNGILLARPVHAWAHANPAAATRLGWHVRTGYDPLTVPAWLARPWPGWWLLRDDDGPLSPAHPEDHPGLPNDDELRRQLPGAARGALA